MVFNPRGWVVIKIFDSTHPILFIIPGKYILWDEIVKTAPRQFVKNSSFIFRALHKSVKYLKHGTCKAKRGKTKWRLFLIIEAGWTKIIFWNILCSLIPSEKLKMIFGFKSLKVCFYQVKFEDEALECLTPNTGTRLQRRANSALSICPLPILVPDILVDKKPTL